MTTSKSGQKILKNDSIDGVDYFDLHRRLCYNIDTIKQRSEWGGCVAEKVVVTTLRVLAIVGAILAAPGRLWKHS